MRPKESNQNNPFFNAFFQFKVKEIIHPTSDNVSLLINQSD